MLHDWNNEKKMFESFSLWCKEGIRKSFSKEFFKNILISISYIYPEFLVIFTCKNHGIDIQLVNEISTPSVECAGQVVTLRKKIIYTYPKLVKYVSFKKLF